VQRAAAREAVPVLVPGLGEAAAPEVAVLTGGEPVDAEAPPVSAMPIAVPLPSSTAPAAAVVRSRFLPPDQRGGRPWPPGPGSIGPSSMVSLSMSQILTADHG
jgi:hypothetical protein